MTLVKDVRIENCGANWGDPTDVDLRYPDTIGLQWGKNRKHICTESSLEQPEPVYLDVKITGKTITTSANSDTRHAEVLVRCNNTGCIFNEKRVEIK